MIAASTIEREGGYAPSIIYRNSLGEACEFELIGVFADASEAIAVAIEAVEAMREEMRAPLPEGYYW